MATYKLLSIGKDAKTVKGEKFGYLTGILYLAPASLSGVNLCPQSSAGCRAVCLYSAGMGVFQNVQQGRLAKSARFLNERDAFMRDIVSDIRKLVAEADKKGMKPVVRLNGTSDIQWENITVDGKTVFEHFPTVDFMDYTKIAKRMFVGSKARAIANYHLTFSRSEENGAIAETVAAAGGNVAAVFATKKGEALPSSYMGRKVISGDNSDLRFLDEKGVIVGLIAKGKARKDTSGFVVAL